MSDIQDLIAHSTVKAFNQGAAYERERIVKLLKDNFADTNLRKAIIAVIKGENK